MALTECLTDVAHIAAIVDALLRMTSILDRCTHVLSQIDYFPDAKHMQKQQLTQPF